MPFYSKHQTELQKKYGGEKVATRLLKHRVNTSIGPAEKQMIESARFFFIASGNDHSIDCSIKAGDAGFVQVISETELGWPDYDGNRMYRTLGNISKNPVVSMLFVDFDDPASKAAPDRPVKLRIKGHATIDDSSETLARFYGAKRVVKVAVEYVFPNCPRYLPSMEAKQDSIYTPRPGSEPPTPEWKTRDYIVDIIDDDS